MIDYLLVLKEVESIVTCKHSNTQMQLSCILWSVWNSTVMYYNKLAYYRKVIALKHCGAVLRIKWQLSIDYNVREDLSHELIEAVWIDVLLRMCKPLLLAACYRPPNQKDIF